MLKHNDLGTCSLNDFCRVEGTEQKLDMIHAEARILWQFPNRDREQLTKLFEYSRQDVVVLRQLFDKTKVIQSFVNFASDNGVSIAHAFMFQKEHLVVEFVHKEAASKGYLYPYNFQRMSDEEKKNKLVVDGAMNFTKPGVFEECIEQDIGSAYPNSIIEKNISPETIVGIVLTGCGKGCNRDAFCEKCIIKQSKFPKNARRFDSIETVKKEFGERVNCWKLEDQKFGFYGYVIIYTFEYCPGVLSTYLKQLFEKRQVIKDDIDAAKQKSKDKLLDTSIDELEVNSNNIKLVLNTMYGLLNQVGG